MAFNRVGTLGTLWTLRTLGILGILGTLETIGALGILRTPGTNSHIDDFHYTMVFDVNICGKQ